PVRPPSTSTLGGRRKLSIIGDEPMRLDGSCHCGAVRFTLESAHPYPFNLCYCSICRKTAGGGGFAINLGGSKETLSIDGGENLRISQATIREPGEALPRQSPARRHFCALCGSHLCRSDPRWPDVVHPLASAIATPIRVPHPSILRASALIQLVCRSRASGVSSISANTTNP